MANITNATIWDAIRDKYPQFAGHTAKATKDLFTQQGWEAISANPQDVNDFFALSVRVYLQMINVSRAKDRLEEKGFGEYYDNPMGGIIQRMAIDSIKPVSPAYKGLVNGSSVDPFIVRKPKVSERFWKRNFDYQSILTLEDQNLMRDMFINPYGIDEFMAGCMTGLQNGYINQVYLNKLEAINDAINSVTWALKDTQKYEISIATPGSPNANECINLIQLVKNIVSAMDLGSQTDAYNAYGFSSTQDINRLKMLVRPGYKTAIETLVLANAYNQEKLQLPIDVIEVPHFGGLIPQVNISDTLTTVYPIYNEIGEVIGYDTNASAKTPTYTDDDIKWLDPNADQIAVIADKGAIFTSKQTGYSVESIRNPRGMYNNLVANSPNNTIVYDPLYNFVTIKKSA